MFIWMIIASVNAATPLLVNTSISHEQISEWSIFTLDTSSLDQVGYIRFTLSLDTDADLILCLSTNQPPSFDADKEEVIADYADYNGWYHSYENQYITVSTLSITSETYIGVGSFLSEFPVPFTLRSEFSDTDLCPKDCSGHGSCVELSCDCDSGYIDYDCGTSAKRITIGTTSHYTVDPYEVEYGYFVLGSDSTLTLELEWSGPTAYITMDWNNHPLIELPTAEEYYYISYLFSDDSFKTIRIDTEPIKGQTLYFAVFNDYKSPVLPLILSMKVLQESNEIDLLAAVYIILVICGIVFGLWFMGGIIKYIINKCIPPGERIAEEEQGLPNGLLDQVSPKRKFREVKTEQSTICIICLDEMQDFDVVRQLYCTHVFHADCIEVWLGQHNFCCLCKRNCSRIEELNVTLDQDRRQRNSVIVSNLD